MAVILAIVEGVHGVFAGFPFLDLAIAGWRNVFSQSRGGQLSGQAFRPDISSAADSSHSSVIYYLRQLVAGGARHVLQYATTAASSSACGCGFLPAVVIGLIAENTSRTSVHPWGGVFLELPRDASAARAF